MKGKILYQQQNQIESLENEEDKELIHYQQQNQIESLENEEDKELIHVDHSFTSNLKINFIRKVYLILTT